MNMTPRYTPRTTSDRRVESPLWRGIHIPPPPPKQSKFKLDIKSEIIAGLGLLLAVLVVISLVSYQPNDPSLNTVSGLQSPRIHNYGGVIGSFTADLLLQTFGIASYFLVIWLLRASYRRLKKQKILSFGKAFLAVTLALTLWAGIFDWFNDLILKVITIPIKPGGLLGLVVSEKMKFWLGIQGGLIALISLTLLSTVQVLRIELRGLGALCKKMSVFLGHVFKNSFLGVIQFLRQELKRFIRDIQERKRQVAAEIAKAAAQAQASAQKELAPIPQIHAPVPALTALPVVSPEIISLEPVNELSSRHEPILTEAAQSVRPQIFSESNEQPVAAPYIDDSMYAFPTFDLLEDPPPVIDHASKKEFLMENARLLVQKLKAFDIEGHVEAICPGPVITMYEVRPQEGVKISKIANLADDLSLALSAESVRIIAPIPGKSVVGIEIPNDIRDAITLKEIVTHTTFRENNHRIPIAFGKDIAGEVFVADLYQMPHLMVAGSTGSGKSVFINTVICSLLFKFTPSQVKMILIDPKMVELSMYEGIPHLLLPVVTDSQKASLALQWAVEEMERRYELMHDLQVRNIDSYNRRISEGVKNTDSKLEHAHLPMIVIVVDELADLMMTCPKDVEISIARLSQKARAAGLHLIVATQRPDTTVITGTIKANFTSRVSFRVSSRVDSTTILDDKGADKLLGRGDMLVRLMGMTRITRLHGAFVSEKEVSKIVEHVRSQGSPTYDESILIPKEDPLETAEEDLDHVYDQAVDLVCRERIASISLVQRRLRIGYNRAARIIEAMERQGIIAPSDGTSRPRKVLLPPNPVP